MKSVIILRSCSGAGKTTFANYIDNIAKNGAVICCADNYFYTNGVYNFDGSKLRRAHDECKAKFSKALECNEETVIVANTNTERDHYEWYMNKAKSYDYAVFVVVMENYHGNENVHSVPNYILDRQESAIGRSLTLR